MLTCERFAYRVRTTSEPQGVVHCDGDLLLRTQITLRRLDRAVPKQELDLLQVAARLSAELGAGPAEVVRSKALDPNLLRRLLDDRPDRPVARLSPTFLPPFEIDRSNRPSSIPAAVIQALIPCLTQTGMATVRTRLPSLRGRPAPSGPRATGALQETEIYVR